MQLINKKFLGRSSWINERFTFIGRERELKELDALFADKTRIVVLYGLGGVGKTTLAKKFVTKHAKNSLFNHVCWIDYQHSLQQSFINQIDHLYPPDEPNVLYQKIIADSNNLPGNNLLIIDGFDSQLDEAQIKSLPAHFNILITSRYLFESKNVTFYYLDMLSQTEAKKMFYMYFTWGELQSKSEVEREKLLEKNVKENNLFVDYLLKNVGYHTLTIEILAKTLRKDDRLSLTDLLDFNANLSVYTENAHAAETSLEHFLGQVFNLSGISEKRIYLLQNLAILPSVDISQSVLLDLLQIKENERIEYIDNIYALVDRGFLSKTISFDKGEIVHYFRCHQIIQAFIRHHRKYKPKFADCRDCVVSLIRKLNVNPEENPLEKAIWLPYAAEVLEQLPEKNKEIARLAYCMAWIYRKMGDFKSALDYEQKDLQIIENMSSSNDSDLAISYSNAAAIHQALGNLPKGLKFAKKAMNIYKHEHLFSLDDSDLAISYDNVGLIYQSIGDFPKALSFAKKALKIFKKVLQLTHPTIAISYDNLASIYQNMGKLSQALEYSKKALAIREKILPEEHPDLATSYNNLGTIYQNMGKLSQALEYSKKALAIREKILPEEHPDLATSYNNLGTIYQDMGDLPRTLEYTRMALEIREKVLPKNHPDLATSYNNLGTIYQDMKKLSQALEYSEKALMIRERILLKEHPDLALSYNNIASIYYDRRDYNHAKEFIQKAIVILQKVFPQGHPYLDVSLQWQEVIAKRLQKAM